MSLQIPYLGGPVALGSLYDAGTGHFLTGVKLWSPETTAKMTTAHKPDVKKSTSIESELTFSEKANRFGISAHQKRSLICGTIEVEGSGKYLNDSKTSINSESLTLSCSILTDFKELHLGPEIEHPKFLDDGSATHVVTGITFGARAFLVFEREKSEAQKSDSLRGPISMLERKLQHLEDFEFHLQNSSQDSQKNHHIKCRYYGDFKLEPPPLTLKEAFICVESFTSDNANSPIQVYLTPLSQLGGKTQTLISHISEEQLNAAGDYCQVLNDVISAASARMKLLEGTPWQVQRDIISEFVKQVQQHRIGFSDKLMSIMPASQEWGLVSEKFISFHRDSSPFSPHQLQIWLRNKERECGILQYCADKLARAEAKCLSDPCAMDRFELEAGGKYLIEIFLPQSLLVQHLKDFLNNRRSTVEIDGIGDTWIQTESQAALLESIDRVARFLRANPSKCAAFVTGKGDEPRSVQLQIKHFKDFRWVPFRVPLPPTDLRLYESSSSNEAEFLWTAVEDHPVEYRVDVFKAINRNRPYLRCTTAKSSIVIESSKLGKGSFEVHVSTVTPFGVSVPSKRVAATASSCSIM